MRSKDFLSPSQREFVDKHKLNGIQSYAMPKYPPTQIEKDFALSYFGIKI